MGFGITAWAPLEAGQYLNLKLPSPSTAKQDKNNNPSTKPRFWMNRKNAYPCAYLMRIFNLQISHCIR